MLNLIIFSPNSKFSSIKGTTIGITVWLRVCPTPVRAITWHPKFFSWSKFHNETECCILGFLLSEFYLYLYRVFGGGKIISQNDVIGRLITPFVLIYHTVYCWGFKLSLKKIIYSESVFFNNAFCSILICVLEYLAYQGCPDHISDLHFSDFSL